MCMKMCKPFSGLESMMYLSSSTVCLPWCWRSASFHRICERGRKRGCLTTMTASAWASEVARKAHLDVICAHILQVELGTHICIIQKGVQDNLEWSHDPADGCADDHHQFVLNEASVRRLACLRLLLEEGQDTRGQLRGETSVPYCGC